MTIQEKAAYIKGLADGLHLDDTTPEGKLIAELINLVSAVADEVAEMKDDAKVLREYVEELDDDLADVEDYLFSDEDDDEDDDWDEDDYDDEDDEDEDEPFFYEAVCPSCGDTVCFDDTIDPENVTCPGCGEVFACEFECDGNCDGCDGCDEDPVDSDEE